MGAYTQFEYGHVPSLKEINSMPKTFNVISSFSGVGGSSLGYKIAGGNVLAAIEFLDYQARTYRHNHAFTKLYEQDVRTIDALKLLHDAGLEPGQLDIFDGSPPCSDFSIMGKRDKAWGQEKPYGNTKQRVDDLFFEYIRLLEAFQPKVFIAENVPGLIKGKARGYFNMIYREMAKLNYHVEAQVIEAHYCGVAQARRRLIFQGVRKDLGKTPVWPEPGPRTFSIQDVISDINPKEDQSERYFLSETVKAYWQETKPGKNLDDGAKRVNGKNSFITHYRLDFGKPCPTVVQGSQSLYHMNHPRTLTIRELKRVASFPDDFEVLGSFANQWEAIGRSVPPLMMAQIAGCIRQEILEKV